MVAPNRIYNPVPPQNLPPEQLSRYLFEELYRIGTAFQQLGINLQFDTLHVQPARPRDGLLAYADGTDWDPGFGEGLYVYSNGAWVFLGGAGTAPDNLDAFMLMGG